MILEVFFIQNDLLKYMYNELIKLKTFGKDWKPSYLKKKTTQTFLLIGIFSLIVVCC